MKSKSFKILLVEDDPGDAQLTQIGLSRSDIALDLSIVDNGQAALNYLHKQGEFKDALLPHLILLDLNLPGLSGREVLFAVKQEPSFRSIPIVVFSTSDRQEDIAEAYDLGANCYVRKQSDLQKFLHTVEQVETFWLKTAELRPEPQF